MTRNHNLVNRRGVWYIRARVDGRDVWRSLKTGDVKEARRLRDSDGGKLTGELSASGDLKLSEAFGVFEGSLCRRECSKSSLRGYRGVYEALRAALPRSVDTIGGVDAQAYGYAASMGASGISAGTYNAHLGALGYVWATIERDYDARGLPCPFPRNPWACIRRKDSHSVSRLPFTVEHVRRLLLVAPDDEWRDLVIVAAHTGLRRIDFINLHSDSVDMERGILSVLPAKTGARSKRKAIIGMSKDVRRVLMHRNTDGLVFPAINALHVEKPWALGRVFSGMVASVGLEGQTDGASVRKRCVYGFHSFRHGYKMALMAGGVADSLISIALCHTQGAVADAYTHAESGLLDAQLIAAAAKLPGLGGPVRSNTVAFKVA